jgi:hypothetical protein
MRVKSSEGNVMIEFLIYILFLITFLVSFIDFYAFAIKKSNMNKVANLISSSIGKDQKNFYKWNDESTKVNILEIYDLESFNYVISCLPKDCSSYADIVEVEIYGKSSIIGFPISINAHKQSSISKFRVR